ncbi:MAG: hypothetical protein ACKVP5_01790 [Aestuariivirga sp.]
MSKIKNFLTIVDKKASGSGEPASYISDTDPNASASAQLMNQLRDFIVTPSAQMAETRYMEILNVIEDHRNATERRLEKVDRHLTEAADKATVMTFNIESHDEEIRMLRQQVADELQAMREQQKSFMDEMLHSLEHNSRRLFDELSRRAEEFETATHNELRNMSSSLAGHISREDQRWDEERRISSEMMEQLVLQWRSERENGRREDMENLASSMMDIGRRLMSPQPHA